MTSVQEGNGLSASRIAGSKFSRFGSRVDGMLESAGDRLNPILVKEARQALKSRQFLLTFLLVLLGCWVWSILGVAQIGEAVYYGSYGPRMFMGYYMILAGALLVIIPYTAYRSLAAEREDRTYELLSITTLSPAQIIAGKLASSVLQMLVYLSAIGPCLTFTYMLRGMDVRAVAYVLVWTCLASAGLALVALFAATLFKQKHWQGLVGAGIVIGLMPVFMSTINLAGELVSERFPLWDDLDFWRFNLVVLTAYFAYGTMIYFAAAAQLSFASDNKSTRLRIVMLAQHGLLAAWLGYGAVDTSSPYITRDALAGASILFALHWFIMGALLSGESPRLSNRVRRGLPQSGLARALFTWFNPGPASGIVFALLNLCCAVLVLALLVPLLKHLWEGPAGLGGVDERLLEFGCLVLAYVTFFLCSGKLLVDLLRKVTPTTPGTAVAVHALLLVGCGAFPPAVGYFFDIRMNRYSLLYIGNPLLTLAEMLVQNTAIDDIQWIVIRFAVPAAALLALLLNVPSIVRELRQSRLPNPQRVAEDDAQAAAHGSRATAANPWT